jgi:hypothetical protein
MECPIEEAESISKEHNVLLDEPMSTARRYRCVACSVAILRAKR